MKETRHKRWYAVVGFDATGKRDWDCTETYASAKAMAKDKAIKTGHDWFVGPVLKEYVHIRSVVEKDTIIE